MSDYTIFSSIENWNKWNRSLLGTALDHKCEKVLKHNYCPDPCNPDEVDWFQSQNRFMYSVFCNRITEPSAVDILRGYSDQNSANFGDAQSAYADLCDHFNGGAVARVHCTQLETKLTTMRLNKDWTKSVTAFINSVSQVIQDHKELTNNIHGDLYYLEKLNATFEEHDDMLAQIQNLDMIS